MAFTLARVDPGGIVSPGSPVRFALTLLGVGIRHTPLILAAEWVSSGKATSLGMGALEVETCPREVHLQARRRPRLERGRPRAGHGRSGRSGEE